MGEVVLYTHLTTLRMQDIDAAGILFFPQLFRIAEEAMEVFFEKVGVDFPKLLKKKEYLCPVVHAEGDYHAPLRLGERLRLDIVTAHVGRTSFSLKCLFYRDEQHVADVTMVQVCVDWKTFQKRDIPSELINILQGKGQVI